MMLPPHSTRDDQDPFADPRRRLAEATDILLDARSGFEEQLAGAQDLYRMLGNHAGFGAGKVHPEGERVTVLPGGMAISPQDAAWCMLDLQRTRCFLLGVDAALEELSRRFPGERLRVLYVGCGPFATLAVPLMPWLQPERVGFTMLDIHQACLDAAARVVAGFGMEAFVDGWVQGDAVDYHPPAGCAPHLLVVECLQKALRSEPQLAITAALAPFLVEGGLMVPERITVRACLLDPAREFACHPADAPSTASGPRQDLGMLIELTARQATAPAPLTLTLPAFDPPGLRALALLTHIDVLGDIALGDYDSEITDPTELDQMGDVHPGQRIELRYRGGNDPGFEAVTLGG